MFYILYALSGEMSSKRIQQLTVLNQYLIRNRSLEAKFEKIHGFIFPSSHRYHHLIVRT